MFQFFCSRAVFFLLSWLIFSASGEVWAEETLEFNRDIRPILSDKCFQCHGPDPSSREAELRLDEAESAYESVLVPGVPDESELIARIISDDEDLKMPPAHSGKKLSREEIELLRQWVESGAEYQPHWSLLAPIRPELPDAQKRDWVRNPIDAFVLARMEQEKIEPSPQANSATLLRRLTLDLTGLPPSLAEVKTFLADPSDAAYEAAVDRLLQSEQYGERMAMTWLDAARYSDTDGFQIDVTRSNWPWRDWVIDAYNRNMPFDQFTIEQFAGDLLPDATPEQKLATCFHRNHMTNGEGGRDPEESRIDYVRDRVDTMGTVWLGLTLGCCQCHSHKFDPITQAEYYQLTAFFDSIDETGVAGLGAGPYLKYESSRVASGTEEAERWLKQKQEELDSTEKQSESRFDPWLEKQVHEIAGRGEHPSWHKFQADHLSTTSGPTNLVQTDEGIFQVEGSNPRHDDYFIVVRPTQSRITGLRLTVLPDPSHPQGGLSLAKDGRFYLTNMIISKRKRGQSQAQAIEVASAVADVGGEGTDKNEYGPVKFVLDDDPRTGWVGAGDETHPSRTAQFGFRIPLEMDPGDELTIELRHRSLRGQSNIRRFRLELTDERGPLLKNLGPSPSEQLATLGGDVNQLKLQLRKQLLEQFQADDQGLAVARQALDSAQSRLEVYSKASGGLNVMILKERAEPRKSHVLLRGVWDQKGDVVEPKIPVALSDWPEDAPRNRLGLAQWLVHRDHPLTARVAVNRYWQIFFGAGLVRTPEDFGAQGEPPTHPDLLDWLATEFMESCWDTKHILRLIVTSATYRQSSDTSQELLARDIDNRFLARAGRFRLPSWMIRDAALRSSGLLDTRLGGLPVYPWQPSGVWSEATTGKIRYQMSVGSDVHRRSLYTFWRRNIAPTNMFDAPKRRVCQTRVTRTNTPLHSLTLLNDTTYVEAARVLAQQVLKNAEGPLTNEQRITSIYQHILTRPPEEIEVRIILRQLERAKYFYTSHPEEAAQLLANGRTPVDASLEQAELAATTVLANTVFNLDEAITRE